MSKKASTAGKLEEEFKDAVDDGGMQFSDDGADAHLDEDDEFKDAVQSFN